MDEEPQDSGCDSDCKKGSFLDAVTGEENEKNYEEEFLPEEVVPVYKIIAVDKNTIANATVDADENIDAADNLPCADDASTLYTSILNTT